MAGRPPGLCHGRAHTQSGQALPTRPSSLSHGNPFLPGQSNPHSWWVFCTSLSEPQTPVSENRALTTYVCTLPWEQAALEKLRGLSRRVCLQPSTPQPSTLLACLSTFCLSTSIKHSSKVYTHVHGWCQLTSTSDGEDLWPLPVSWFEAPLNPSLLIFSLLLRCP